MNQLPRQTTQPVEDKVDTRVKPTTPIEQNPGGDAPGGQPLEAHDQFRAQLDERPKTIQLNDRAPGQVTEKTFTQADGTQLKLNTVVKGDQVFGFTKDGQQYRIDPPRREGEAPRLVGIPKDGVRPPEVNLATPRGATVDNPTSTNGRKTADPVVEQPAGVTNRRTVTDGAADPVPNRRAVTDGSADPVPGSKRPRTEGEPITQPVQRVTGAEKTELQDKVGRQQYRDLADQAAALPAGQRDAFWREQRKANGLETPVQTTSGGERPVVAAVPERKVAGAVTDQPAAVADAKPLKDRDVAPGHRNEAVVPPVAQWTETQRQAAQTYADSLAKGVDPKVRQEASRGLQSAFPEGASLVANSTRQALRENNGTFNPEQLQARFTPKPEQVRDIKGPDFKPADVRVADVKLPGGNPIDGGDRNPRHNPIEGGDRNPRNNPDFIKGMVERTEQFNPPGLKPGEARPGFDIGQRQAEWAKLQELKSQPKDQPFPPNWENKFKNNPEMLAQFQQKWAEARDKDGRGGDLTMRGRQDGGDQASRALDAIKGGQNQKGIPGFDMNDKATREFLSDAMKRLEMTKGQRVEDIFKGLDPSKADRLTKFLTEGSTDGKFNPARVKELMGLSDGMKNPTERLYDFMKGSKDAINNQTLSAKDTQRLLSDLTKMLGDVNKQLGVDGSKNALRIEDILGRKLDPTRPGERLAAMEQNGINRQMNERADAMALVARITPAQEMAIRQMLDLRAGKDPVQQATRPTGQEGQQAGREIGPGARFEGPQARMDAAQAAAQNAARMDIGNRPEVKPDLVKAEGKPEANVAKPDAIQAQRQQDIALPGSKTIEAKSDRPDALNPLDRKDEKFLDEKAKREKKEEEEKEKREKEDQHKREEKARLDALMLAALAEKKRKQLEQEQKEKEKSDEKDKQRDREKRRRYIVREKDTLQSIATTQLRDVKLSPLIYEINKEVILLRVENGKQVPDLKPKMIIWLPSTTEIEEFRKGGVAGARASGAPDKKMTADEELIARFGAGWSGNKTGPGGPATGAPTTGGPSTGVPGLTGGPATVPGSQPATSAEVTAALAASAMEAAQKKRANIESLLGPIGRAKPADGRIKYIARLGDSLKSVAMKHPALQDVNLWKLLAEVNGISTETDSKGAPVATLTRGAILMIPSNVDVESYRAQLAGAPNAVLTTGGVRTAGVVTEVATKLCEGCGRMTVNSATICPACGAAFAPVGGEGGGEGGDTNLRPTSQVAQDRSSQDTVRLQQAQPVQSQPAQAHHAQSGAESTSLEDAKTVFVQPPVADEDAPTRFTTGNHTMDQLNDECRIVKCDGQGVVCQLEVSRGNGWEPVVSYEIYDDVSMRNEFTPDGRKRSVRIDLPPQAARELAVNDLNSNWKGYCGRFLGKQID